MRYQIRNRSASKSGIRVLLLVLFGWFSVGYQPCLMAQSQPQDSRQQSSIVAHHHDNVDCSTGHFAEDKKSGAIADVEKTAGDSDKHSNVRIVLIIDPNDATNIDRLAGSAARHFQIFRRATAAYSVLHIPDPGIPPSLRLWRRNWTSVFRPAGPPSAHIFTTEN